MFRSLKQKLSIQSKLTILVLVSSIVSAVVVGAIAFKFGKRALTRRVAEQMNATRVKSCAEVENYLSLYCKQIQTLTESDNIIQYMRDFRASFGELRAADVTLGQREELLDFYRTEQIPRLVKHTDGAPIPEQMLPATTAGQYLQYHYIAQNPHVAEEKYRLVAANDTSSYSQVHAVNHAKIRSLVDHLGYYDFILVDADSTNVVYSYRKEIDFGAQLNEGLLSLTKLSQAIDQLRRDKDQRSVAMVDFESYRPSYGSPAAFVASPIFDHVEMIGILVLQMPIQEINNLLTHHQNWRAAGLGETGEVLLVGDDYLLRSESRFYQESPDQLLSELKEAGFPQRELQRVQQFQTLIMNTSIHTEAVEKARLGKSGFGKMLDYRGKSVLISYGPLDIADLNWNIVAKLDVKEAYLPTYQLGKRLLVTICAIALCTCLATIMASHRLLRPLKRIMEGVQRVTDGNVEVEVPVVGDDEFAHLATAFNKMTQNLRDQRARYFKRRLPKTNGFWSTHCHSQQCGD